MNWSRELRTGGSVVSSNESRYGNRAALPLQSRPIGNRETVEVERGPRGRSAFGNDSRIFGRLGATGS